MYQNRTVILIGRLCTWVHTYVHTWPDLPGPLSSTGTVGGWGSCLRGLGLGPDGRGHWAVPSPCTSASRGFPCLLQGSASSCQGLQTAQVQSGSNVVHPHPITGTCVSFSPSFGTICCDNLIKQYCIFFYAYLNVKLSRTKRTKTGTQMERSEAKSCF